MNPAQLKSCPDSKDDRAISVQNKTDNKVPKESICSLLIKLQTRPGNNTTKENQTSGEVDVSKLITMDHSVAEPTHVNNDTERGMECTQEQQSDTGIHEDHNSELEPPTTQSFPHSPNRNSSASENVSESNKRLAYQKSPILLSNNLVVAPMTEAPRIHMVQPGTTTVQGQDVPEIRMILPTPLPPDSDQE